MQRAPNQQKLGCRTSSTELWKQPPSNNHHPAERSRRRRPARSSNRNAPSEGASPMMPASGASSSSTRGRRGSPPRCVDPRPIRRVVIRDVFKSCDRRHRVRVGEIITPQKDRHRWAEAIIVQGALVSAFEPRFPFRVTHRQPCGTGTRVSVPTAAWPANH